MAGSLSLEGAAVSLGGRIVLAEIDLALAAPGWFGLLGANGSGKTTLLRALCGRVPVAEGRVRLDGEDATRTPERLAAAVGYAPPLDTLPGALTVGELVDLVAAARSTDPRAPLRLYQALELDRLRDRVVGALSSGLRQRVALFTAFVGAPRFVLLDEPFNWLDPVTAYDVKACLAEFGRDVVVITALHDITTFATRCQAGWLLQDGRLVRRFAPADLERARSDPTTLEREVYDALRSAHPRSEA